MTTGGGAKRHASEEELSCVLADACCKLSRAEVWMIDIEAQMAMAAQAGMKAYKAIKE